MVVNSARNFINPLKGSRKAILNIAIKLVVAAEKIPKRKNEINMGIPKRSNLRKVKRGKGIFNPDSLKDQSSTKTRAPKRDVPAIKTLLLLSGSKFIIFAFCGFLLYGHQFGDSYRNLENIPLTYLVW